MAIFLKFEKYPNLGTRYFLDYIRKSVIQFFKLFAFKYYSIAYLNIILWEMALKRKVVIR